MPASVGQTFQSVLSALRFAASKQTDRQECLSDKNKTGVVQSAPVFYCLIRANYFVDINYPPV